MADRVRRVSFLVDLGAGTAEERAQVRLVLSRVLTHLSRQSPAPPRWSFRFYDSSLTPQRFDARMHARAKASSAVDPKLGAAASLRRDEFHACTPDAIAAVLRQYDQAVDLYNAADAEGANHVGTPPEHPGDLVDGPDSAERTGWFTTLARQMAGVIQRAAGELAGMTGDGDGGGSERQHSAVVILARVRGDAPAPSNDENDPSAQPPRTGTEVDFLRPFKGIEDAYRKENTRAYLLRLGGRDTRAATAETTRRASELFARFGGSSAPVAAVSHAAAPRGCLPPGLLMSAFARVRLHPDGRTTPSLHPQTPLSLGVGSTLNAKELPVSELWVRRGSTTSEARGGGGRSPAGSSSSSAVRLGAIAVVPCDGWPGGLSRIRRVTIASLASVDQLAACWVTGRPRPGVGGSGVMRGYEGVRTSIAVAAKGSAAYALGALLAIRRAGAIVELEVECDREEERAAANRIEEEEEDEEEEEEALATQETDATTAAGGGGGRRGVRNARPGSVHLAALQPLSPGTMSLVPVAPAADAPNTPGRDADAASADVASDVAYNDADVDALTSALAAACGDDGWGALEPFFPDLSGEDAAARGASGSASEQKGNLARIIAHASTGDDADGSGGEATNRAGRNSARGDFAAALAAAAAAAPAGTHRWERWYGGGPVERKSFGDSLAASIAGAPNGAGVLSPGPLRLPGVGCDDGRVVDGPSESDAALDARFRAMVGDGGNPDENPAAGTGTAATNRAAREGRRREGKPSTAPTATTHAAWVLDDLPSVLERARSEYDALFERYFAVSDADAPDPDFAKLSKTLAGDAVGSARVHLPAGQNCLDDAVDAVEGALVMSQVQLEARHVTGGCKGAKRREHAFQAHLSLSLHSLRSANSKSDKRRTKKAAKHLAKVVNPLSFLLHPVGIQALHAFVLDELVPRYDESVPRLMEALRANLGVGAVVERTGRDGDSNADSNAKTAKTSGRRAGKSVNAGVFSPGVVAGRKTAGGGGGSDEYGGESGESSEAPGSSRRDAPGGAGKPDREAQAGSFKMPNPKTGVKWHNLFRSRAGPAKREVRMAPVKSAEELRKAQDEEAAARREKEKRALFLREQRQRQQPAQREKLLMVPPGFQPTPDAGNRKVMQMPAPRNLALAAFGAGPGSQTAMTPGRQAAIAAMQTPLPNRNRRESVSMTPGPRGGRLSEIMSTPMAMSTPRSSGGRGTAPPGSRGAAMLQQAMCTPARETVVAETPAGSRGMVVAATPLHGRDGGGVGAQQQQRVGARKGMLGFGAMVREAREAEEEQAPSKRAKKMFTFGGRGD